MPSTYQNMLTLKASAHSENCHKLRYQVKENRDLCVLSHRALQTVSRGAKLGIDECQFQFRASRWNCTTFHNIPSVFGGVLNVKGSQVSRWPFQLGHWFARVRSVFVSSFVDMAI
ncbi:hypothetical protein HPB50_015602 [Hyalomma asiaticum]|uniref:Uncharacterized protein n=1 Tax=Hyalomma asiaticum TaxID=266040 RepID=A0ACB7SYN1_HYAAI|nr:hypothetical protein HPB50_015602 [Hyalomma asiaticum]